MTLELLDDVVAARHLQFVDRVCNDTVVFHFIYRLTHA